MNWYSSISHLKIHTLANLQEESSSLIWLLPILAALIGWVTNYLAVKMLFHPRQAISIGSIQFQGVFPKRQKQLAVKLGTLVAEELLSMEQITNKIRENATSEASMDAIGKRIEKTIREKLVHAFPMLSMFLSDEMVEKVTNLFRNELKDFLAESVEELSHKLEKELDIKDLVCEKVEGFSSERVEKLLVNLMKKEFKFIELVGAVLGFFIGCVQLLLTATV
jgi:uncharacterized membrane protein YheB (UPF0754 family)|tara:strand:- start:329 stop:994 length:666 start_codon:yes stop_codon:yes gene_type:complete